MADHSDDKRRPPATTRFWVHGADDLVHLRRLLVDTALRAGLPADRVERFAVALNEIATNAIIHGGGTATVVISSDVTAVVAEVSDHGRGLNEVLPLTLPVRTDHWHGRGLWLARQLCDDLTIRASDRGTTVRLTTRL